MMIIFLEYLIRTLGGYKEVLTRECYEYFNRNLKRVHNSIFILFLECLNIIKVFKDYVLKLLDDDNVLKIFNKNSWGI